ncbi:MAG: hypothetical protein QHC40_08075 [Sphingobium sp.]|nr:hypothetical protein [Sphingobium sp.]
MSGMVHQWTFVIAAYALTLLGTTGVTFASWRAMRRAERRAAELDRP